jgi:L,D-peptidoglycan transpeptidase YkuD (ErfK/YbiS/YcfS/YnhG family)
MFPPSAMPFSLTAMRRQDGWCDDPDAGAYNRYIRLPSRHGHEELWRCDRLYDVIVVMDHNHSPRRKNAGSAVFFHLAEASYAPTAGCVAITLSDMRRLLPRLSRRARMIIQLPCNGRSRPKNC